VNTQKLSLSSQEFGNIAFAVVVVAGFSSWLSGGTFKFDLVTLFVMVSLGLAYLGLGTWGERLLDRFKTPWMAAAYFIAQLALGGAINYLSLGTAWLVLLPLASVGVERLPVAWALLVCAAAWGLQVAPLIILGGLSTFSAWAMPFLAAVVFVAIYTRITVNEQEARARLAEANQKLRQYAAQVEQMATVQERNRLAREIHDGLGHYLTAINIQIKAAQAFVEQDPNQARTALENAQNLSQEALADVRRSISELRADPSTSSPLPARLQSLLDEARASGIRTELTVEGAPAPLSPQVDFTLYRVAQEGLTNVRKHASASQAKLRLAYTKHSLRLSVTDDGVGAEETGGGFGLTGLQERVQLLGGTMQVDTAPGKGFTLSVEIPRLASSQT
jgi:signal transduction histidine kinase